MNIRKHIKTAAMIVIFGLIIIAFSIAGLNTSLITGVAPRAVVVAGQNKVDMRQFARDFASALEGVSQEQQRQITQDEAVANGMHTQLLQDMAQRYSLYDAFRRLGMRASNELVANQLRDFPGLFDPVTGQFSRDQYRQLLNDNGLTEEEFEQQLADGANSEHMFTALLAGTRAPLAHTAFGNIMQTQKWTFSYFLVTPNSVGEPPMPTDEQLTAFMEANAQVLRRPELRELTIVRFSRQALMDTVEVDEEEIERQVEFRREQGGTPEARSLVQLTVQNEAAANTIAERLRAGADAQALAEELDAGFAQIDNRPATAIADQNVAEAAFALENGEVSGPIETELGGVAVVKVTGITPAREADMAMLRQQAEEAARQRAADSAISTAANQLQDAVAGGADLVEAAREAGAQVFDTPEIASNGAQESRQPVPGLSQAVLSEAFGMSMGSTSDVLRDAGEGEYFMVRVDGITPPEMPALEDLRAQLTPEWRRQTMMRNMQEMAESLSEQVRGGGEMAEAAREAGAQLDRVEEMNGADAQAVAQRLGPSMIQSVLNTAEGEVIVGDASLQGASPQQVLPRLFVAKVEETQLGDLDLAAQRTRQTNAQASEELTALLEQQMLAAVRNFIEPKVYPDRARQALGLQPLEDGAAQ